jgi:hypothetical protein
VPGWYPDPYDPTQLRYWNGEAWTESTTPAQGQPEPGAGGAPGGPSGAGPDPWAGSPPFTRPPSPAAPGTAPPGGWGGPSGLGDIGSWLSGTFSTLTGRLANVGILLFAVPLVGWLILTVMVWALVSGMSFNQVTEEFEGFNVGLLLLTVLVAVIVLVVAGIVTWLAATHQLYVAHLAQERTIAQSLSVALRRLPRVIGWGLVLGLAAVLVVAILGGVMAALVAGLGEGALALLLLIIPVVVVGVFFLWVKLAFFATALVVAPAGTNPITTSWGLSAGRFWAVLGRVLVLYAVVWGISFVFNIVFNIILAFVPATLGWEVDEVSGDLLIDGQNIDDLDVIDFDLFLPNPAIVVVIVALMVASQAATQAVSISGYTALYQRAGGPVDPEL